jgi:hypothetical protein
VKEDPADRPAVRYGGSHPLTELCLRPPSPNQDGSNRSHEDQARRTSIKIDNDELPLTEPLDVPGHIILQVGGRVGDARTDLSLNGSQRLGPIEEIPDHGPDFVQPVILP